MDRFDHAHYKDSEDIAHRINDDLSPDWLLDAEDKVEDTIEPITPEWMETWEDGLEQDIDKGIDDLYDGDAEKFVKGNHSWWDYLKYFRWISNALFVGVPWFVFSIIMFILNIVGNIWLNQWWSDANPMLVA